MPADVTRARRITLPLRRARHSAGHAGAPGAVPAARGRTITCLSARAGHCHAVVRSASAGQRRPGDRPAAGPAAMGGPDCRTRMPGPAARSVIHFATGRRQVTATDCNEQSVISSLQSAHNADLARIIAAAFAVAVACRSPGSVRQGRRRSCVSLARVMGPGCCHEEGSQRGRPRADQADSCRPQRGPACWSATRDGQPRAGPAFAELL